MSVIVTTSDGDARVVPIGAAGTVAGLLDVIHDALGLRHPTAAYELCLEGPGDGGEGVLARRLDATLADIGITGSEERVAVRLKYAYVVRGQLADEDIATEAAAADALRAAIDAGAPERVRQIAAAGLTPLHEHALRAIAAGDGLAEALLAAAREAPATLGDLNALLFSACTAGARGAAAQLLALGADANAKDASILDNRGAYYPLQKACTGGKTAVASLLLDHGAHIAAADRTGRTALHQSSGEGHTDVVKLLLSRGAHVDVEDSSSFRPLDLACSSRHREVAEVLIDSGADVNYPSRCNVLLSACLYGFTDIARLLLDRGANVNLVTASGRAPLAWAAEGGHKELAELLLDRGADVTATCPVGGTALSVAAARGHCAFVAMLLHRGGGASPGAVDFALRAAVEGGRREVAELLMDRGADVNARQDGKTPLLSACTIFPTPVPVAMVQLLVERGACVNDKDDRGVSALQWACMRGYWDTADALIEMGADVNAGSSVGFRTPLHEAYAAGRAGTVQKLVDRGADIGAKDAEGRTPQQCASEATPTETFDAQKLAEAWGCLGPP